MKHCRQQIQKAKPILTGIQHVAEGRPYTTFSLVVAEMCGHFSATTFSLRHLYGHLRNQMEVIVWGCLNTRSVKATVTKSCLDLAFRVPLPRA
jgi:hypothetical protein